MAAYWIWWVLAGVVVAAELLIGTFYLLAVGVAFAVGGVAAWRRRQAMTSAMSWSPRGQNVYEIIPTALRPSRLTPYLRYCGATGRT